LDEFDKLYDQILNEQVQKLNNELFEEENQVPDDNINYDSHMSEVFMPPEDISSNRSLTEEDSFQNTNFPVYCIHSI